MGTEKKLIVALTFIFLNSGYILITTLPNALNFYKIEQLSTLTIRRTQGVRNSIHPSVLIFFSKLCIVL